MNSVIPRIIRLSTGFRSTAAGSSRPDNTGIRFSAQRVVRTIICSMCRADGSLRRKTALLCAYHRVASFFTHPTHGSSMRSARKETRFPTGFISPRSCPMYKATQTRMIVLINKSILQIKLATQEKMICLENSNQT